MFVLRKISYIVFTLKFHQYLFLKICEYNDLEFCIIWKVGFIFDKWLKHTFLSLQQIEIHSISILFMIPQFNTFSNELLFEQFIQPSILANYLFTNHHHRHFKRATISIVFDIKFLQCHLMLDIYLETLIPK